MTISACSRPATIAAFSRSEAASSVTSSKLTTMRPSPSGRARTRQSPASHARIASTRSPASAARAASAPASWSPSRFDQAGTGRARSPPSDSQSWSPTGRAPSTMLASAVALPGALEALVLRHLQRADKGRPGLARVDDGVDHVVAGGDVDVDELAIGGDHLRLVLAVAEQDLRRALGPHDRDLGARPRD